MHNITDEKSNFKLLAILTLKKHIYNSTYWTDKNEVDIKKRMTSVKVSYSKKGLQCFIAYQNDHKIKAIVYNDFKHE